MSRMYPPFTEQQLAALQRVYRRQSLSDQDIAVLGECPPNFIVMHAGTVWLTEAGRAALDLFVEGIRLRR